MKKIVLIALLIGIIFISGCIGQPQEGTQRSKIENDCINACESALQEGRDLSSGPCLSNSIASGWVCDVAHSPRQTIDDQPENQCSAFREGVATHFVEVTPSCEFIQSR